MRFSETTKGYLFVFISVIALSNVYIFSKVALSEVHFLQFGVYWFFFAFIWNLLLFFSSNKFRQEITLNKKNLSYLPVLGILELLSTGLFFYAIKLVENPTIISFISNIGPIYIIILGFIFLKERFNKWEITGIFITIIGAVILNYNKDFSWGSFFFNGIGFIFLSSFIFAISSVLAKSKIKSIHPWLLTINRIIFIFTGFLVLFLINKEDIYISHKAFYNILLGSLLGPFLAVLTGYYSFKYIKVSKISVLGTSKSFFILAASYFFFNTIPTTFQIIGGTLMIAGVITIVSSKRK
ncbi:MAG TPA: hypothetical protein EYP69_04860 [Bacteroidales bacterium]|nr:hypothetical protein [Bacteroidales bacterium]